MKKMHLWFFAALCALLAISAQAQTPAVSAGRIERHEQFPSQFVSARNVDVWLPEGYSPRKKYAVLYMHDGQMLFDGAGTWNKQEWQVDEIAGKLLAEGKIRDCIVVGIWNGGQAR
ncbi:MAG TPA: alpha/beta hydrolase-fold protein, partial [Saprospiraceae bacterium]|nr:alpha/beta hydrolase-fold protein [Saprospiraceae bacterium]